MGIQHQWIGRWLAVAVSLLGLVAMPARGVKLADGSVYFAQAPRLVKAVTTHNAARFWGATYYFTLSIPDNAGEPLGKVVITPDVGIDYPDFDLSDTEAFAGTYRRPQARLSIQAVTIARETRAITVVFDPAIAAGKTITIGLYPLRNPNVGGVYLYGVTAFPAGEKAQGQFLGFGRIHIYDGGWNMLLDRRLW